MVASSTSSTSSAAVRWRSITRLHLSSSSIRFCLLCSRPAVSTSTTSAPPARAALDRVEGDGGGVAALPRGNHVEVEPRPHSWSCSIAAARKVSAAARSRACPSATASARLPVVFAAAVDADDEHDGRAGGSAGGHPSARLELGLHLCEQLGRAATCAPRPCAADARPDRAPSTAAICRAGVPRRRRRSAPPRARPRCRRRAGPATAGRAGCCREPVCDRASRARSRTIRPAEGPWLLQGGARRRGRLQRRLALSGGAVAVAVPVVADVSSSLGMEPVEVEFAEPAPGGPLCMPRGRSSIVPPMPSSSTATTTHEDDVCSHISPQSPRAGDIPDVCGTVRSAFNAP